MIPNFIKRLFNTLEDENTPWSFVFITFCSSIILRNFLEHFTNTARINFYDHINYFFEYLCVALSMSIIFTLSGKISIQKSIRVVFSSFLIILLAPTIDFFYYTKPHQMAFIPPNTTDMLMKFLSFFGNSYGVTAGIKIEIAVILFSSFLFFRFKKVSIFKSFLLVFLEYIMLFLYASIIYLVDILAKKLGFIIDIESYVIGFFIYMDIFLANIIFFLYSPKLFKIIIFDSRVKKIIHYMLMPILGTSLYLRITNHPFPINSISIIKFSFIFPAIYYAALFSIIINNIADINSDSVNSPERPLIAGNVSLPLYSSLSWIFLLISLIFSMYSGYRAFISIFSVISLYNLYSIKPFRIKRLFLISKLTISLNSLILLWLGFKFFDQKAIFPVHFGILFFISISIAANFIDLKDNKGDKIDRISTISTLLGEKISKLFVGISFIIAYPLTFSYFHNSFITISGIIFSIIEFFLINRKQYNEKPVLILYLISMIFLIFSIQL